MNLSSLRQNFERKKGQRLQIQKELDTAIKERDKISREISVSEKAQSIIQVVAQATQNELEYRITEPVSLALKGVYQENPYKMVAKFEITGRGTTECHLGFERNGYVNKPLEGSGGGPVDIASFSLRIGSWSLTHPRSRPILCLDEPFKWVSRNKMSLAGQMLKEISEKLNLQVIIISHIPELISCADKIIEVGMENRISYLKED